jgi:hypothetical protein
MVGRLTAPPSLTELALWEGLSVSRSLALSSPLAIVKNCAAYHLFVVLFQKDLPNEWPTSVAQLSSMTQRQKFARLLAGDIVESISSRTARHFELWPHRLRCGSSGVLVDPVEDVSDQVDD